MQPHHAFPSLDNWIVLSHQLAVEAMAQNQQPNHETVAPLGTAEV